MMPGIENLSKVFEKVSPALLEKVTDVSKMAGYAELDKPIGDYVEVRPDSEHLGRNAHSDAALQEKPVEKSESNEASEDEDNNECDEMSEEEINEKQVEAIKDAFKRLAKGEKLSTAELGNLGEMLMDQYYISQGYTPIHKPRVTDLEHKSGQGIDGVYEKTNPDGTKSYVIADAKVNGSQLNKGLADGTDQMSDEWIDKRLDNAVGKEKADEIRDAYEDDPNSVSKEVYHYSTEKNGDGNTSSDVSTVDEDGNKNHDTKKVETFDDEGNVINDSTGEDDKQ